MTATDVGGSDAAGILRRSGARLRQRAFQPVDAASVAAFRVIFGLLMLVLVARFFAHGWIAEYYLTPKYFFPHYGFGWARPWPGLGMYLHYAAMGVLALLIAAGAWYRLSVVLFTALFAYAHLIDKTNYLNHYYLLICLGGLMSTLPLARLWSVDGWRNAALRSSTVPSWVLYALRAQVGLVYVFGGIAKLKPDWLIDAQPLRIWLAANTDFPVLGAFFDEPWVAHAMSYAGALFDLSVVPCLLWRKSRSFAYLAIVVFHLTTARLFQLGMFPWIMMLSSLLFLSPSWPRRLLGMLGVHTCATAAVPAANAPARPRFVLGLLAVYFGFHVLMPLRHLLYPGNVCWTEEGFRFAWNVMLMEKNGSTDFRVVEPSTGRLWRVSPGDYLTRYQTKMMSSQPDMILQFAHILAEDFRARGVSDPEVFVDAFASLNGRRRARLIEPTAELSREVDGLAPKRWILPLAEDDSNSAASLARHGRNH